MEPVFTIGYGSRSREAFLAALSRRQIGYLIDVRSNPRSNYRPEFSKDQLKEFLENAGISYVPMGDALGGRPSDPSCYREGHVIYDEVRERRFFKIGIRRIQTALRRNLRVCLMCSEGKPEQCHRSKLIGATLDALGVQVIHIGAQEEEVSQRDVLAKLAPAQSNLFGNGLISRKTYRVGRLERAFE
jgi:uncharacterized protein (DUF488 family)